MHFLSSHVENNKNSFKLSESLLSNIPSENLDLNVGVRYLLTLLYIKSWMTILSLKLDLFIEDT